LALYGASAFTDKAPDITWETWPDKLIRAAMSVVNYNLPLDIFTACFLARLIQRIAEIQKRQLYKALSPHKDPVSRPLHSPDRREFRFVHTLWSPKPAAVRLCLR
jgi:hypothetical protein